MITHKSIGYSGRLGNQMFQYAALKAIALKNKYDYCLPNNIKIKPDGAFDFINNKWIEYKLDLIECFDISCKIENINTLHNYQEKEFNFNPDVLDILDNTSIDGYFQSFRYFEEFWEEIKKDFSFINLKINKDKISQYNNPVSIHIRRGDYVNHPNYWNIDLEYIQKALLYFEDNNYTFLIFSDDMNWCKEVFPEGVVFVEENQFDSLCLMSLCQHNIISNSSFSWWGAYLNNNKNKKIVAPHKWFSTPKPLNDLYPPNWIII